MNNPKEVDKRSENYDQIFFLKWNGKYTKNIRQG
jgi:hypothetical protein